MTEPIRAKVIACLQTGYLDILVGYEYGMLSGGIIQRIDIRHFPDHCRMPNTIIRISYAPDGTPFIELCDSVL